MVFIVEIWFNLDINYNKLKHSLRFVLILFDEANWQQYEANVTLAVTLSLYYLSKLCILQTFIKKKEDKPSILKVSLKDMKPN